MKHFKCTLKHEKRDADGKVRQKKGEVRYASGVDIDEVIADHPLVDYDIVPLPGEPELEPMTDDEFVEMMERKMYPGIKRYVQIMLDRHEAKKDKKEGRN